MKLTGIKPSARLLLLTLGLALLCLAWDLLLSLSDKPLTGLQLFFSLLGATVLVALHDMWQSKKIPDIQISRQMDSHLSVHIATEIALEIANKDAQTMRLMVADLQPDSWQHFIVPETITIAPDDKATIRYHTTPRTRGAFSLKGTQCRLFSLMGLWQLDWRYDLVTEVKVYPDFRMLHDLSGLQGSATLSQEGLRKFQKRGSGLEFKQLRDYRTGESLRQVDWRATSRFNKLISREYQDEKNQSVVIMLDAGQRMMVQDASLTYFDHALNTLIALSHTVLKNGDELSLLSFGQKTRWLGKVKGVANISHVLNHFFDLHPKSVASDYLRAASELVQKCPKRSLVILVSCLRDEDFSDLLKAVKLLQKHHLVAVASIEDSLFPGINQSPVESHQQAGTWLATQDLMQRIEKNQKALSAEGVICISASAGNITPSTINAYLKVKRAGIL